MSYRMRRLSSAKFLRIGGTAIAATLASLMLLPSLARTEEPDACTTKVPQALAELLAQRFPGYRLPRITDQSREDRSLNRKYGGDGCFTVASGDFGGHRGKDFVVLLVSEDKSKVRLVAALRDSSSWTVYDLPSWCGGPRRCYVKRQRPGVYRRTESIPDPPSEPGDTEEIRSKHDSILSGTLESTAIVHVFKDGSWQHVWISD